MVHLVMLVCEAKTHRGGTNPRKRLRNSFSIEFFDQTIVFGRKDRAHGRNATPNFYTFLVS